MPDHIHILIGMKPSCTVSDLVREIKKSSNDFINDNYKQKKNLFCIVHGVGSGILRRTTNETLRKNKKVIDFKTYYYNQGCTVVEIDIEN